MQRLEDSVRLASRRDAEAGSDERVRNLEVAWERQAHLARPTSKGDFERGAEAVAPGRNETDRLALGANRHDKKTGLLGGFDDVRRNHAVGIDDGGSAFRQKFAEEAKFGGEIILDARMIIHVVARQVREGARRNLHPIEPALVEAMRRGFERQMGHPRDGKPVQRLMQGQRIGRRQRAIDRQRAGDDASRAERGRLAAERGPDLADKGRDRSLSARSRNGDHGFRLSRKEPLRGAREGRPSIGHAQKRRRSRAAVGRSRVALADDRDRAARKRLHHVLQSVVLRAGEREEHVTRPDLTAVEGNTADLALCERSVGAGKIENFTKTHHPPGVHSLPSLSASAP